MKNQVINSFDYFETWQERLKNIRYLLFFDTETSGLDYYYNTILSLSWQVVDTKTWLVKNEQNLYFDWQKRIDEDAIKINGLTKEKLAELGTTNRREGLKLFFKDMKFCPIIIAHNIGFDLRFIKYMAFEERLRYPLDNPKYKNVIVPYCTMKETTDLCKLAWRDDSDEYKWPKLEELARCLGVDYSDLALHQSSSDVELTKRCFKQIVKKNLIRTSWTGFY